MEFIALKSQYLRAKSDIDTRMQAVLTHGQFIMGPEIEELEKHLAARVGSRHCVTCASGTDALLIALMALNIQPRDEVITTAFSFIATAEAIALLGAVPVFVDINPRTYNIDPAAIEAAITSRTKAIMPVSLYGQCAEMDAINQIAGKHGLPVVEDAAQSFGATYQGRGSCGLTKIGCTSLFPSKPLGAYGDGGACFTDDANLAEAMAQIRVHGQERRYYHTRIGLNGRLHTLQAAILLGKLQIFDEEIQKRSEVADWYAHHLRPVQRPYIAAENRSVYAQYTIEVDGREAIQASLKNRGIPTAVHYPLPLHQQPALARYWTRGVDLPHTQRASQRVLSLPMHPYMSQDEVIRVCSSVKEALASQEANSMASSTK